MLLYSQLEKLFAPKINWYYGKGTVPIVWDSIGYQAGLRATDTRKPILPVGTSRLSWARAVGVGSLEWRGINEGGASTKT